MSRNSRGDASGVGGGEVGKDDHGEQVIDVGLDGALESSWRFLVRPEFVRPALGTGATSSGGRLASPPPSQRSGQKTKRPLETPPPRRHAYPMIANSNSRSLGSILNNRRESLAPPVPILRRATLPPRRVPSSGKSLESLSHALRTPIALTVPLPALPILSPPSPCAHPHETRVNRTSCTQNDPPVALSNPLPSPRKSTFPPPESRQPPTSPTMKPRPLPALPIAPPPSPCAHPHETHVNPKKENRLWREG